MGAGQRDECQWAKHCRPTQALRGGRRSGSDQRRRREGAEGRAAAVRLAAAARFGSQSAPRQMPNIQLLSDLLSGLPSRLPPATPLQRGGRTSTRPVRFLSPCFQVRREFVRSSQGDALIFSTDFRFRREFRREFVRGDTLCNAALGLFRAPADAASAGALSRLQRASQARIPRR